jgi:hypothetical protein
MVKSENYIELKIYLEIINIDTLQLTFCEMHDRIVADEARDLFSLFMVMNRIEGRVYG